MACDPNPEDLLSTSGSFPSLLEPGPGAGRNPSCAAGGSPPPGPGRRGSTAAGGGGTPTGSGDLQSPREAQALIQPRHGPRSSCGFPGRRPQARPSQGCAPAPRPKGRAGPPRPRPLVPPAPHSRSSPAPAPARSTAAPPPPGPTAPRRRSGCPEQPSSRGPPAPPTARPGPRSRRTICRAEGGGKG